MTAAAGGWLRAGLAFLAAAQGLVGLVQLLLPRVFYDDFPARSHPWVAMLPPYNEHLMRDVGALNLATALVLAVAAVHPETVLVRTALAAALMFAVPHLAFHVTHLEHFQVGDAVAQTAALAVGVLIPAALLALTRRRVRT
ncbi:MAG: hypothetical protein ACJ73S_26945 [Mycobacteriales bacterium]